VTIAPAKVPRRHPFENSKSQLAQRSHTFQRPITLSRRHDGAEYADLARSTHWRESAESTECTGRAGRLDEEVRQNASDEPQIGHHC
jgi:hypothetical protein